MSAGALQSPYRRVTVTLYVRLERGNNRCGVCGARFTLRIYSMQMAAQCVWSGKYNRTLVHADQRK